MDVGPVVIAWHCDVMSVEEALGDSTVAIVIPIHNAIGKTCRLLDSLRMSTGLPTQLIAVDSGSTDGSLQILAEEYPEVDVIAGASDWWWAKATNAGIQQALVGDVDHVVTLNQDAVVEPDTIAALVRTAEENPRSLVGAKICSLEDPDIVWFAGADFDPATADVAHRRGRKEEFSTITRSEMLTGLAMLIPQSVFEEIGMFDDDAFPQYFADCDFSLRARSRGYQLLVDPTAIVLNETGSSWLIRAMRERKLRALPVALFSSRSPYWLTGRIRFYRRHWGRGYVRALFKLYFRLGLRLIRALIGRTFAFEKDDSIDRSPSW